MVSLGLKRDTLVRHVKCGLCYVSGYLGDGFSLYSLRGGERLMQHVRREDFKVLTRIAFRTQFLSMTRVKRSP
jgi:hypothetical protein